MRALALALLLAGCASAPKLVTVPDVCPALPKRPPQVATVLPEELPTLPANLEDAAAAGELLRVRVDSAAQYQACRANNEALRDWIIRHTGE